MRNAEYIQSRSPNGAPATYRPDPRFGPPDQWQNRREMRLELKYLFQARATDQIRHQLFGPWLLTFRV